MNLHEEIWIEGREYDLVHILRSTFLEIILVDIETDKVVSHLGSIDIV